MRQLSKRSELLSCCVDTVSPCYLVYVQIAASRYAALCLKYGWRFILIGEVCVWQDIPSYTDLLFGTCSAAPSGDRAVIGQKAQPTGSKANEEAPSENMGATVCASALNLYIWALLL